MLSMAQIIIRVEKLSVADVQEGWYSIAGLSGLPFLTGIFGLRTSAQLLRSMKFH